MNKIKNEKKAKGAMVAVTYKGAQAEPISTGQYQTTNFVLALLLIVASGLEPRVSLADVDGGLQEIVVTAQKRQERLQDVPVPVTALSGDSLIASNTPSVQEYYATVPGLNFSTDYHGQPQLSIRGISGGPGAGNPTVSVTVDDVPFGPSSSYGGDIAPVPDLDPADLAQIEILRGPQGTLYGASSIGGLVKFVTTDPSTEGYSGRIQADVNHVYNGVDAGYGVRGSANLPASDSLALRVSGFYRKDPGYIDNIVTGQRSVNSVDVFGGRLAALWRVADTWSVKFSALYQHSDLNGASQADPALGDLKQNNIPGSGETLLQTQAYSATVSGKIGMADFTSVTGYNIFKMNTSLDLSPLLGGVSEYFGVSGMRDIEDPTTHKFSQEMRLSLPITKNVDWLLGVFYTHEDSSTRGWWLAEDNITGAILGNALDETVQTTYQEYSVFTDVTVHFTEKFDVQFGGRESQNKQTYYELDGGGYSTVFGYPGAPAPVVNPQVDTKDNAFTYLITPRFKITPDVMAYMRVASGYRPGGPNPTCLLLDVPCHFNPDRTQNYELGIKADAFDRMLSFDGSIYYINWKDIQLSVTAPSSGAAYYANAGRAKSQGIELSSIFRPLNWLSAGAWIAYNDAVLKESFPPTSAAFGQTGARLPFSSRVSANFSLQEDFALWEGTSGYVKELLTYVGDRIGIFQTTPERQYYPSYVQLDLNAGVRRGTWTLSAYLNNVTDRRGVLSGGLGSYTPGFTYTRPRIAGLNVTKEF